MNSPVFTEIILIICIRFLNTIASLFPSILETRLLNDYDVLFNISFISSLFWGAHTLSSFKNCKWKKISNKETKQPTKSQFCY